MAVFCTRLEEPPIWRATRCCCCDVTEVQAEVVADFWLVFDAVAVDLMAAVGNGAVAEAGVSSAAVF